LLPLGDEEAYAWLGGGAEPAIRLGTHGRSGLDGKRALFAWSRGATAYGAIASAWKRGLSSRAKHTASLREQKIYPEIFTYLGWCSWECYGRDIDEEKMLRAVHLIEESGLPIRSFLMDEGHADNATLQADKAKFPRGYRALTAKKNRDRIRWFGLWWAFLGAAHGVPEPGELGGLRDAMMETPNGVLVPKPDETSARRFYEHILRETSKGGFDFVKIDFMVDALPLYAGLRRDPPTLGGLPPDNQNAIRNPYAGAATLMRVCEQSATSLQGIINCNWHNAVCLFHSGASAVGRCSEDYQSNQLPRAKAHIYHAFSAIPWLGQMAWGDHDMFHSTDRVAALPMAISKALSGGPIYLSDEPSTFVKALIEPLCFSDGRLLRPLAPGTPVEEDLSYVPDEGRLLRVIAPLRNGMATLGIFHLESEQASGQPITALIGPQIYRQASSMMQPREKPWTLPAEGVVAYDVLRKTAHLLSDAYAVSMSEFGCVLLQLCPVWNGWSLVGREDKYLPGAAVRDVQYANDQMSFLVEEEGRIVVWSAQGTPAIHDVAMVALAPNLYVAEVTGLQAGQRVHITRS
jgi:Raffinose synthase or seed imbibition protein Sip1